MPFQYSDHFALYFGEGCWGWVEVGQLIMNSDVTLSFMLMLKSLKGAWCMYICAFSFCFSEIFSKVIHFELCQTTQTFKSYEVNIKTRSVNCVTMHMTQVLCQILVNTDVHILFKRSKFIQDIQA